MQTELEKLKSLLEEGKMAEAKQVVSNIANAKSSSSDHGDMLLMATDMYMEATNSMQKEYKSALEKAIAGIEKLKKSESAMGDKLRIEEVKASLGK